MPVLRSLSGPKMGFSPGRGDTIAPILRLSGQKCGNRAPNTVKISNFGHKFAPQERLICTVFTKFSAFVRVMSIGSF